MPRRAIGLTRSLETPRYRDTNQVRLLTGCLEPRRGSSVPPVASRDAFSWHRLREPGVVPEQPGGMRQDGRGSAAPTRPRDGGRNAHHHLSPRPHQSSQLLDAQSGYHRRTDSTTATTFRRDFEIMGHVAPARIAVRRFIRDAGQWLRRRGERSVAGRSPSANAGCGGGRCGS